MSVNNERISFIARVLKKYSYSKTMMFLDVIGGTGYNKVSIHSVVIKSDDKNGLTTDFDIMNVHAGDIVSLSGILEKTDDVSQLNVENRKELWNVSTVVINKSVFGSIEKVSDWSIAENSTFYFDEQKFLTPNLTHINQFDGVVETPIIILQAKNKAVDKTIDLLRSSHPQLRFRESSTVLPKSKDRMILVHNSADSSEELTVNDFASSDILSQSVTRVYAMRYRGHPHSVHPDLDTAIEQMREALTSSTPLSSDGDSSRGVRIQAFPRYVSGYVVDHCEKHWGEQTVQWSPSQYSHILSAVYVDAVWMLSLVPRSELAINDIYESSNKFGSKNINSAPKVVVTSSSAESGTTKDRTVERVCKSANKLHEILTRNDWVYDAPVDSSSERPLHRYGLCVDIGASPGGWTTYLASSISSQRVIGVDRGVLLIDPLPAHVEHWQMLGQVAVDRLYAQSLEAAQSGTPFELVDLYCCDANISPALSTALLLKCSVEYKLFKPNARFVLTLKNTLFRKEAWEAAKSDSFAALSAHFKEVRIVSLLANTPKECTVTGIFVGEE